MAIVDIRRKGDGGTVTSNIECLPSSIRAVFRGQNYSYYPKATEKWYYKLTDITKDAGSGDLIGGQFLQGSLSSSGKTGSGSMDTVASADKVKFLFVKNTGKQDNGITKTGNSVYLLLDAGALSTPVTETDAIEIGSGETLCLKLNTTVASIHTIAAGPHFAGSSDHKIQCVVAALIEDV